MRYKVDVSNLTIHDYVAAGNLAAETYNDHWLGCDVLKESGKSEDCTVVVEYKGVEFEVWLEGRIPHLS
jgi:hypothetical protein